MKENCAQDIKKQLIFLSSFAWRTIRTKVRDLLASRQGIREQCPIHPLHTCLEVLNTFFLTQPTNPPPEGVSLLNNNIYKGRATKHVSDKVKR